MSLPAPHRIGVPSLVVLLAAAASGQCPPASTYVGFHQEGVGSAIAAQGEEAFFGHLNGYCIGHFEKLENETWLRTTLSCGGSSNPSAMGRSVALRGDLMAMGDPQDSTSTGGLFGQGAMAIIERVAGTWTTAATFFPPAPSSSIEYGDAVAISEDGTRVAVSAPKHFTTGAVYLYEKVGGSWVPVTGVAPPSLVAGARFGDAVHFQGGRLFVGAPGQGVGGSVYVFALVGGTWTEQARLAPAGAQANDGFGTVLTGAGTTLFGSTPWRPVGAGTGRVVPFELVGGVWIERPSIVPGTTAQSFGRSLAFDGSRLAVGGGGYAGVFESAGGTSWSTLTELGYPDAVTFSNFGSAVALYDDGLLVGAPSYDDNPFLYPESMGAVHSYDLSDLGQPLVACGHAIDLSAVGGESLLLDAPAAANRPFVILGSITGTTPTSVSGLTIPLVPDAYFFLTAAVPGGPTLPGGVGTLDAAGRAQAKFSVPGGLPASAAGLVVHHAFVAAGPSGAPSFASNAVSVTLVP